MAVGLMDLANWLAPGLSRMRLFPRQPIERGMNNEDSIKVSGGNGETGDNMDTRLVCMAFIIGSCS